MTPYPVLTENQRRALVRAAELKRDLASFAREVHLRRQFRKLQRRAQSLDLSRLNQTVVAIETLLFEYRLDDGSSVLDRYLSRNPSLSIEDRLLIESWAGSVHSYFEVVGKDGDTIWLVGLLDDLSYTAFASAGPASLEDISVGNFVLTRVLPVDDVWMLSGLQLNYPPDTRPTIAKMVAEHTLAHPESVLRNPEYRAAALRIAARLHEAFVAHFGADLAIVSGGEVADRYREFLAFYEGRRVDGEAWDRYQRLGAAVEASPALTSAETVALHSRPTTGVSFYAEYGAVAEVFFRPELVASRDSANLVVSYLEDATIPPWIIERLVEPDVEAANQVLATVLGRPGFDWAADGDALMRRLKPSYFGHRLDPHVVAVPAIAREYYATLEPPEPPEPPGVVAG